MTGGGVAPGYEAVAEAFAASLPTDGRAGAAFAAVHDGRLVVDLWGGIADPATGRPWAEDTLQVIFSGTKALVAVCVLLLIERGQLALDDPVGRHWPEFAAAGKERIRVRDVVSHTARLPGVHAPLTTADLCRPDHAAALLAAQPPERDPRAAFAYHPLTYGWLCAELVRRVDGRTVGTFFADEVAGPLGLDVWIGLPAAEEPRVAVLRCDDRWATDAAALDAERDGDVLATSIYANPPYLVPGDLTWNTRAFHAAEIPGGGAIGSARDLARLYGCLARGGELDGVRLLAPETIALGAAELSRGVDPFADNPLAFGVGFQLQTARRRYGPPADAFGHDGAGGSVHCAWPSQRIGLSYAPSELRWRAEAGDPRVPPLLERLHAVAAG